MDIKGVQQTCENSDREGEGVLGMSSGRERVRIRRVEKERRVERERERESL